LKRWKSEAYREGASNPSSIDGDDPSTSYEYGTAYRGGGMMCHLPPGGKMMPPPPGGKMMAPPPAPPQLNSKPSLHFTEELALQYLKVLRKLRLERGAGYQQIKFKNLSES